MNHFPRREIVVQVRKNYPAGCRVVLDEMDDVQAPPLGTQGTVYGVDDAGSILCRWDTGGGLSVAYGVDSCHKIRTAEEAKVTLDWYGKRQPEQDARCPRCGEEMRGPSARQALSRWADIMVCSSCGREEALEQAGLKEMKPLMQWHAIAFPLEGKGPWQG